MISGHRSVVVFLHFLGALFPLISVNISREANENHHTASPQRSSQPQ